MEFVRKSFGGEIVSSLEEMADETFHEKVLRLTSLLAWDVLKSVESDDEILPVIDRLHPPHLTPFSLALNLFSNGYTLIISRVFMNVDKNASKMDVVNRR
jgi:hypothetical protein